MALQIGAWCRDLQPKGAICGVPGNHFELADQGSTTVTMSALAIPAKFFRAVVYVKGYLTNGSVTFWLQASDSAISAAGQTINIDGQTIPGSAGSYSFILQGFAPDTTNAGLSYMGIRMVPNTNYQYDVILDGLP